MPERIRVVDDGQMAPAEGDLLIGGHRPVAAGALAAGDTFALEFEVITRA